MGLYNVLFGPEVSCHSIIPLDKLYFRVLQHTYGHRASEVHPFILEELNPLHVLIQANVVLLGSPAIASKLAGWVGYLQKLRAICAIAAFECLGTALRRDPLTKASPVRQSALIIQLALLLDQVVEMDGSLPAGAISCARGESFDAMRVHLIQYLSYYLYKLVPSEFQNRLVCSMQNGDSCGHLGNDFWDYLSALLPLVQLQKPPVFKRYADLHWDACTAETGEALHTYFATHCSISCK